MDLSRERAQAPQEPKTQENTRFEGITAPAPVFVQPDPGLSALGLDLSSLPDLPDYGVSAPANTVDSPAQAPGFKPMTDRQATITKNLLADPAKAQDWKDRLENAHRAKAVDEKGRPMIWRTTIEKVKAEQIDQLSSVEAFMAIRLAPPRDMGDAPAMTARQRDVVTKVVAHMHGSTSFGPRGFNAHVERSFPDLYKKVREDGIDHLTVVEADALIKTEHEFAAMKRGAEVVGLERPAGESQINVVKEILAQNPSVMDRLTPETLERLQAKELNTTDVDAIFKAESARKQALVLSLVPQIAQMDKADVRTIAEVFAHRLEESAGKTFKSGFIHVMATKIHALQSEVNGRDFREALSDLSSFNRADTLAFAVNHLAPVA